MILPALVFGVAVALPGCRSVPPAPPAAGPRDLTTALIRALRLDRKAEARALLSRRTREDPNGLARRFLDGELTPAAYGVDTRLSLREILISASLLGYLPVDADAPGDRVPTRLWWIFEDTREPEVNRPTVLKLLLIRESDGGGPVWRLALKESLE